MAITDTPPWMKRTPLNNPAHPAHSTHTISSRGLRANRIWEPLHPPPPECQRILVGKCQVSNKELCGFLTTDWMIFPVTNAHVYPRHNYYFDPEDTDRALKEIYEEHGTQIIGQYHSHPNNVPWPSPRDLVGWPNLKLGWRYWIVTNDEVIEWELVRDNT